MACKMDMSKTYDRIEWTFLKTVMNIMGFARWSELILKYVSVVFYSLLLNGVPHEGF